MLDSRRENLYGEQTLPGQADIVTDVQFLPDFPRQSRDGDGVTLTLPALAQVLYYDGSGKLQSATGRWEGSLRIPADEGSELSALPLPGARLQAMTGAEEISLRGEVPVQMQTSASRGMPMVTGITQGQSLAPDPARPSLVIRRADSSLWELAKKSGSRMDAVRKANDLSGEPEPGQLLLIPIL